MRRSVGRRGVTLIELITGMVISTLILSMLILSWRLMTRQISGGRRKTMLESELSRFSRGLVGQIERSPAVINWDENGISFVHRRTLDTLSYRFYNDAFTRNEVPVTFIVPTMRITDFTFSSEESTFGSAGTEILITLVVAAADDFDNRARFDHTIMITHPGEDPASSSDGWNF